MENAIKVNTKNQLRILYTGLSRSGISYLLSHCELEEILPDYQNALQDALALNEVSEDDVLAFTKGFKAAAYTFGKRVSPVKSVYKQVDFINLDGQIQSVKLNEYRSKYKRNYRDQMDFEVFNLEEIGVTVIHVQIGLCNINGNMIENSRAGIKFNKENYIQKFKKGL